jgi:hypothetical protein
MAYSSSVPWPDCAIQGQTIDAALNVGDPTKVGFASPDKERCSDACSKDTDCSFWTYNIASKECTFKTGTQVTFT